MITTISGIRRSGNHAIGLWLIGHFESCEYIHNYGNVVMAKNIPKNKKNKPITGIKEFYYKVNGLMLELKTNSNHSDNHLITTNNILYGIENNTIDRIIEITNKVKAKQKILIIRDPINNLASLLKHKASLLSLSQFRTLWKSYANADSSFIKIIYDNWFSDSEYRRQLENILNLNKSDDGLEKIHYMGSGSSFDGQDFQHDAQKMNVLNRWEQYYDDELYLDIINDPELLGIREKIFGPLPEKLINVLSVRRSFNNKKLIERHNLLTT